MAAEAAAMIPPEDDFELDIVLAEMIGDGLIMVRPDRRLQATTEGYTRLLLADTATVQRVIPGAIVTGWSEAQP